MNQIAGSSQPITAACWFEDKLYIRFSGEKSAVEASVKQSNQLSRAVSENIWQKLAEKN